MGGVPPILAILPNGEEKMRTVNSETIKPRTMREIDMMWNAGPSANSTYHVIIPAGTRAVPSGVPDEYFIDDLSWIADKRSMLYHDATHRGIRIGKEYVE